MEAEIKRAKQEADVVVMSIHWGNEYERYPTDEQKDLAKHLAQMGVDIIFGHHPHVLQPFDWIEVDDRKVFVIYSLGNFLSGQKDNYRDIGGIATIEVTKHTRPDGDVITLADPKFYPTYVTKSQGKYFVVPLAEAEEYGLTSAKTIHHEIIEHMFGWIQ